MVIDCAVPNRSMATGDGCSASCSAMWNSHRRPGVRDGSLYYIASEKRPACHSPSPDTACAAAAYVTEYGEGRGGRVGGEGKVAHVLCSACAERAVPLGEPIGHVAPRYAGRVTCSTQAAETGRVEDCTVPPRRLALRGGPQDDNTRCLSRSESPRPASAPVVPHAWLHSLRSGNSEIAGHL
jgi:hypothetical protein